jgi:hypothetical protein
LRSVSGSGSARWEGTWMCESEIAVYELRIVLDLLQWASNYIERDEGKEGSTARNA